MEPTLKYFAKIFRQIMRDRGLKTQKELATLLGVSQQQISLWFNPRHTHDLPGNEKMDLIAELSGIPVADLHWHKLVIRKKESGVDIANMPTGPAPLDKDQSEVLNLMEANDYAGAVQYLLEMMRTSAPTGGQSKRSSARAAAAK